MALAFAQGEGALGVVVGYVDGGRQSFLIVVVGTLILLELELAIGARIYI